MAADYAMVAATAPTRDWLAQLRTKVARVKHGSRHLVLHDSRVTRIESTAKFRLPPRAS